MARTSSLKKMSSVLTFVLNCTRKLAHGHSLTVFDGPLLRNAYAAKCLVAAALAFSLAHDSIQREFHLDLDQSFKRVDKFFNASSWFPPPKTLRQRTKRDNTMSITCDAAPWSTACGMSIRTQSRRNQLASTSKGHNRTSTSWKKSDVLLVGPRVPRQ